MHTVVDESREKASKYVWKEWNRIVISQVTAVKDTKSLVVSSNG